MNCIFLMLLKKFVLSAVYFLCALNWVLQCKFKKIINMCCCNCFFLRFFWRNFLILQSYVDILLIWFRIRISCFNLISFQHEIRMRWDQLRMKVSDSDLTWNQDQNEIRSLWNEIRWDRIFMKWDEIRILICSDQHVIKKCYQCCKLDE